MRTRFLSEIIIAALCFSVPAFAKMTPPSKDTVKPELEKRISNLSGKGDALWKEISIMEADIKALRKDSPRQKEEDEIYIETVILVLKEIPRPPKFKKEKCADYRTGILAGYDPQGETEPSAAVAKGLQVLDLVCKK